MIKRSSEKGITLISLVVTIIILLILTGVVITNFNSSDEDGKYNNMKADIKLLKDKVLIYYNRYGEVPKTSRTIKVNNTDYYEIDLSELGNITLNYGKDYEKDLTTSSDVYLIDLNLHVYYLKGIERSGKMYHE